MTESQWNTDSEPESQEDQDMLHFLRELSDEDASSLEEHLALRRQREERLRTERALLELLQEVAAHANEAESFEEALRFALDRICDYTGWPVGHVYWRSKSDESRLESSGIWRCPDEPDLAAFREATESAPVEPAEGWPRQAFAAGESLWLTSLGVEEFLRGKEAQDAGFVSGFALPIVVDGEVMALLEFLSKEPLEPDEQLTDTMSFVATQLARVIERQLAIERLQQSEAQLAEAQRVASIGSWEWDIANDRISWSKELYHIYGLEPADFNPTYENFLKLVHPEDRQRVDQTVRTAHRTGTPFAYDHRILRPDGTVRTVHGRGRPTLGEDGQPVRMYGTSQDVTEQKKTEAKLAQRAQQLDALHEMGQTVASSLELEVVFDRVLEKLRPLLGAEGVFILLSEADDRLIFAAANETGVGDLVGTRVAASEGLAGDVLNSGEVQWLHGDETGERIYHEIREVAGFRPRAIVAAPLKLLGEIIGVLEAVHSESDAFDADDKTIMESAANWTAIAIGNARLFQAQEQARQTADTLRAANVALSETLDLQTVLDTFLNYTGELIGFDKALVLLTQRGERLRIEAWRGFEEAGFRRLLLSLDDFPTFRRLFEQRQCIVVANPGGDPEWTALDESTGTDSSWLVVPLVAGDRAIGALALMREEAGAYTERHVAPAEGLAAQATIAIQNARLFAQVQADQRRLRQLNRKVVKAQEEERQRVSRELHDEAGQALTALKINLEMIKNRWSEIPEPAKRQMEDAISMTDQTMEQIRLLAHDLRPPILESFGLTPSLEGLARDFGRRASLEISFQGDSIPDLPNAVTISLYRFVQEALTNVARHAKASQAMVELRADGDKIMVAVTDDGTGFNVEEMMAAGKERNGIGLMGMQDRIELINGWVEIESEPGQGTRVAAHVPMQEVK